GAHPDIKNRYYIKSIGEVVKFLAVNELVISCCRSSGVHPAKFTHVTPLLSSLHWLPIAARIRFKSLVLAFQAARGTAPPYLQSLITPNTPPRPLRSASSGNWQPLLAVSPLLCPDPSLVERPSAIGQDRGITCNLPQETQNPPLQIPLPLNTVHLANLASPLFTCSTL
ncbi:hypothetical protein AAFF_G00254410, partial [Aldrovandia affinis]